MALANPEWRHRSRTLFRFRFAVASTPNVVQQMTFRINDCCPVPRCRSVSPPVTVPSRFASVTPLTSLCRCRVPLVFSSSSSSSLCLRFIVVFPSSSFRHRHSCILLLYASSSSSLRRRRILLFVDVVLFSLLSSSSSSPSIVVLVVFDVVVHTRSETLQVSSAVS